MKFRTAIEPLFWVLLFAGTFYVFTGGPSKLAAQQLSASQFHPATLVVIPHDSRTNLTYSPQLSLGACLKAATSMNAKFRRDGSYKQATCLNLDTGELDTPQK